MSGKRGWVEILTKDYNLSEVEARRFLLYHLAKPDVLTGHYREVDVQGDRLNLPYYKTNNRLLRGVLNYYIKAGDNFGRSAKGEVLVREFVQNWENTMEGTDINVTRHIDNRNAVYHRKYNLSNLDKKDSFIQSMLGPAFGRNPYVEYILEKSEADYVKRSVIESNSGTQKVLIKKPNSGQRRSKPCK